MAAAIPWDELCKEPSRRLYVLDPMMGSGTTLAVARALGHSAIGFDTDPLAVLIARAWCQDVDAKRLRATGKNVLRRATKLSASMRMGDAYPRGADEETRQFVRYWFDQRNRKELAALSLAILRVRNHDLRTLLLCAFSRLIIAKQAGASLALDLAHSRPHRVHEKTTIVRPLEAFAGEVEHICITSPFQASTIAPFPDIRKGDARSLPLKDETVDIVITSPPYVNGIDYQRTSKFSLVWMGYSIRELRKVRSENIGTEAAGRPEKETDSQRAAFQAMGKIGRLPSQTANILRKYIRDIDVSFREVARVLRANGQAVVVIGDSTIRDTFVRNSRALLVLAEAHGLRCVRVRRRRLPQNRRYLPPPRHANQIDIRLRTEAVLHLRKIA